jgi:aconitate hydratase
VAQGVQPRDFNAYGARRGNDQVMTRGTFANIRIKNRLTPGIEGGVTVYLAERSTIGNQPSAISIYDAAVKYQQAGVPTIILAGKEYGTGSSRDWAAKGPNLLGVKAVIAESYERIHRSNLVGMGVLPLQFKPGENADTLGLTGHEVFDITGLSDEMPPQGDVAVKATKADGSVVQFTAIARLNTAVEVEYYRNGGVLNTVLKKMMA